MRQQLPLLGLLLLLGAAWAPSQGASAAAGRLMLGVPLPQDRTLTKQERDSTNEARLIPDALVQGQPLGPPLAQVAADEACSTACRAEPRCRWFAYCGLPAGCTAANGTQLLGYQECQLLEGGCSLHIEVAPLTGVTSGFPVRLDDEMQISGFVQIPAEGIQGGNTQCPESLENGTCSFSSTLAAAATCVRLPDCRAVVVYPNGTDGCSAQPVAVLKTVGLDSADTFVSDSVYTLQASSEQADQSAFWLTAGEGNVLLPSAGELAAGDAALAASDAWKGCTWGANALYEGQVVDTLERVASPMACCRACQNSSELCTVWNWCDPALAVNGTCFHQDTELTQETVVLDASQCQLRYQALAVPEVGSPPVLLAKGPAVPFVAGAPITVWAPEQPGFQRYVGRTLFAWGRYPCEGSLTPQAGECLLQGPVDQLAKQCAANATCAAMLLKPGGIINGTAQLTSMAYFKSDANPSKWILSPTTIMYVKDAVAGSNAAGASSGTSTGTSTGTSNGTSNGTSSGTSSGGSISGGAIAGIVVGAVAVAAAAAAAAWVVLRRRRAASDGAAAAEGGKRQGVPDALSGGPAKHNGEDQRPPRSSAQGGLLSPFGLMPAVAEGGKESPTSSSKSTSRHLLSDTSQPGSLPTSQRGAPLVAGHALQQQQPSSGLPPVQPSTPVHTSARFSSNDTVAEGQPLGSSALPSAMFSAGLSAASLPASSEVCANQDVSGSDTPADCASPNSGGSGRDVLVELMGHVASRDAAQQSFSLPTSTDSSEPGQWVTDRLPQRLHEWLVDPKQIEFLRWPNGKLVELGQGASAHVYKALFNGEVVACKEIDLEESEEMQEAFVTEATRLHALRHPNVIGFYGVSVSNRKGIVIMEFAEGRDLHSALQVRAAGSSVRLFSWYRRGRRVAFELAKALNYLHTKNVIHLDLKSQNVLLTSTGAVRLADVGFSKLKDKTFITHVPLVGTFAWIAPEVLLGRAQVDQSADMFSMGVVLWEIVTGERPQRGSLRMPRVPEECPQDVSDLIMQCLSEEPSERPTAGQLLKTLGEMLERSRATAPSAHKAAAEAAGGERESPLASPRE